jgi:folate-binding Fe-S cluster repair protein YgfZ
LSIQDIKRVDLVDWGVLKISGADTVAFLQGQLSNDVTRVSTDTSVLAGYHNPQGRAIVLLRMVKAASGEILAVLPRELVSDTVARLRKFVLRAKVVLADASDAWRVVGVIGGQPVDGNGLSWIKVESSPSRHIAIVAGDGPDPFTQASRV